MSCSRKRMLIEISSKKTETAAAAVVLSLSIRPKM
jgi:hypothetical protein